MVKLASIGFLFQDFHVTADSRQKKLGAWWLATKFLIFDCPPYISLTLLVNFTITSGEKYGHLRSYSVLLTILLKQSYTVKLKTNTYTNTNPKLTLGVTL